MTGRRIGALALLVLAVGCSSPADVEKRHAAVQAKYEADLAYAQEWNNHVLGIPASGWLTIIIFGSLLATGLLVAAGVWTYRTLERRANHRHQLAVEQQKTRRAELERGRCTVCGADPALDQPAKGAAS